MVTREQARSIATLADGIRDDILALRNVLQEATVVGRTADWATAVDGPLASVKERLGVWHDREAHAAAKVQLEGALDELAALQQNASQAHDFLNNGQRSLATEVVLADGSQLTGALYRRLSDAQRLSGDALERKATQSARSEATVLVGLALMAALGFVALGPVVFRRENLTSASPESPETDATQPTREADVVVPPAPVPDIVASPSQVDSIQPLPQTPDERLADSPAPDATLVTNGLDQRAALVELAGLCTELGRVKERLELESLLDRAMELLDARGLIVWQPVADRALRPVLARGYGTKALARMPQIPLTDSGSIAGAYRAGDLRVVARKQSDFGALILPALCPEGCAGVVTLELRSGESSPAVQALGRILVAQLATIVAPDAQAPPTPAAENPTTATTSVS